jgi:hypothetical protein
MAVKYFCDICNLEITDKCYDMNISLCGSYRKPVLLNNSQTLDNIRCIICEHCLKNIFRK